MVKFVSGFIRDCFSDNFRNGFLLRIKVYGISSSQVIQVEVAIYSAMDDSNRATAFVGLTNQGATCHLNSILQILFHIPHFRNIVYQMQKKDLPSPLLTAVQNLFFKLQYSGNVSTEELTNSLGWNSADVNEQRDAHETSMLMFGELKKQTNAEVAIRQLFEGQQMTLVKCIDVTHRSKQKQPFYDLQLDVEGCHNVFDSFDKYTAVELLDGDNKYHAGPHGLQDAKKLVRFVDFPPVLQLHLKRFKHAQNKEQKINDRYEFPTELNLDSKYFCSEGEVKNRYNLHSVLVHRGDDAKSGHYYAFIKPTLSDQWFKFDDEKVTEEDMSKALEEELYGGEGRESNAYMLVYIRESNEAEMMCDVDEKDFADHLKEWLKRLEEEKELEAHPRTILKSQAIAVTWEYLSKIFAVTRNYLSDIIAAKWKYWTYTNYRPSRKEVEKFCAQADKNWLWAMPPVMNQGACNCCMSATLMGVASATYCIESGGLKLLLSCQHCVDCAQCGKNVKVDKVNCRFISSRRAYAFLIDQGVAEESAYPFVGRGQKCQEPEGRRLL